MGTNITGIGNANAIGFKSRVTGGAYFPPELKDALVGVWSAYGKSNDSTDRNIIKNKIKDRGGDFVISNAAFKLNSGFGKYEVDFTSWIQTNGVIASSDKVQNSIIGRFLYFNTVNKKEDIPSFKVNITLGQQGKLQYNYIKEDGTSTYIVYSESGIYTIPTSYFSKYTGGNAWFGFYQIEGTSIIEQISSFEGAFVTDGINDLITSTKTVQEMGITDEITVVSMIHKISSDNNWSNLIGELKGNHTFVANRGINTDKTGIYGYTYNYNENAIVINNILGDKNDYIVKTSTSLGLDNKYYVTGFTSAGIIQNISQIAWYWTFIANRVLTTDEINQVIAYYNLDRTLRPDILCNITKQGITNDNHADFNDKLIDYSGNGRDIQMNNLAWKGGSGIAAKQYETFKDWTSESSSTSIITQIDEFTRIVESTTNGYWVSRIKRDSDLNKVYDAINVYLYQDNNFLVHECKYEVDGIKYAIPINESVGKGYHKLEMYTKDRYTELPENAENVVLSEWYFPKSTKGSIKYSIIPSCKGGILLDGINDFGKVTGMPIYKDYTVVTDREIFAYIGAILSKNNPGAFVETAGNSVYSFGQATSGLNFISTRSISYLSKYSYCGQSITAGAAEDGTDMWLGTIRDNDSRFFNGAIYSLMSFPYSMSEFLIERQLKKHKLGTLYPDMVEFRPIVKSNSEYKVVDCYIDNLPAVVGNYYPINSKLKIAVTTKGAADEVTSLTVNGVSLGTLSVNGNRFTFNGTLSDKSPQKIDITIDEYIRFEDIVQPYPVLLRFKDENDNEVSWGGKFKVGSTITRIGSAADSNLLPNIYNIFGLLLNGNQVTSFKAIVEKTMVFKAKSAYIFDNNEPNCILSPRLLRIPNSSYKILGYIPDISGHGNNGKINNSAYASMSGANGYPYDYRNSSFWCDSVLAKVVSGELIEYFAVKNSTGFSNITSGVYKGEIKVTGVTKAISENKISRLRIYTNSTTDNELIDITQDGNYNIDIKGVGDANRVFFYAIPNNPNESIVVRLTEPIYIEQVGEYEGAYCLDGVDDFVTIPTTVGGKQVLMKVNWNSLNHVLYDQRNNAEAPFCIVAASGSIAYNQRNVGGNTYIDGILNNHILVDDLQAITHNIVLNNDYNVANSNSFIGTNYTKSIYAKMSLYDFMLFDNISTDDKIKELNEYVGIEDNTE